MKTPSAKSLETARDKVEKHLKAFNEIRHAREAAETPEKPRTPLTVAQLQTALTECDPKALVVLQDTRYHNEPLWKITRGYYVKSFNGVMFGNDIRDACGYNAGEAVPAVQLCPNNGIYLTR